MCIVIVVLFLVLTVALIIFIISNLSVRKANKSFYEQLISKGVEHHEAKRIMDEENEKYGDRIKYGERGVMLSDHLKEVLKRDFPD